MREEARICHECGARMARDIRQEKLEYKSHSVIVNQPGWYCTSCNEGVLSGADIEATEHEVVTLWARAEGLLQPHEVRTIRKQLGLTQKSAGSLVGGGPKAFQKYESGKCLTSAAMSNLLRLLHNDPKRLSELKQIKR